jgi:hypothetical protein
MPKTYEPIATHTLSSAAASYTFTSIPQTYTDLVMIVQATQTAGPHQGKIGVGNGSIDTGSNYSQTILNGNGTSAASLRFSNYTYWNADYLAAPGVSGEYNVSIYNFMNYSNTTTNKTMINRSSKASNGTDALVNLWRSTSAINQILFGVTSSTLAAGTIITLYGIKAA